MAKPKGRPGALRILLVVASVGNVAAGTGARIVSGTTSLLCDGVFHW
jgi:hypothetical protein